MGVVHACEQKNNLRTADLTKKRREVPMSTGLLMKLAWGARWKPLGGTRALQQGCRGLEGGHTQASLRVSPNTPLAWIIRLPGCLEGSVAVAGLAPNRGAGIQRTHTLLCFSPFDPSCKCRSRGWNSKEESVGLAVTEERIYVPTRRSSSSL